MSNLSAEISSQDRKDLSKALGYANWSLIGLIIPFIGWLFGGMSLSFIKLIPVNKHTATRMKQIKRVAWTGIIISTLAFGVWGFVYYSSRINELENAQSKSPLEKCFEQSTAKRDKYVKDRDYTPQSWEQANFILGEDNAACANAY